MLLCTEQPAPLYELLAAADDPSLEIDVAEIDTADSAAAAMERLSLRPFDICLVDANWDAATVADLINGIQTAQRSTQVVRLSDIAEEAAASGDEPVEVVPLLASPAVVRRLLRSALQKAKLQCENRSLKRQLQMRVLSEIVGQSEASQNLREQIRAAADQDGCVLIQGEAGAGNQQAARVVHLASSRAMRPFLVLDCRVHSAESLERELLGQASAASSPDELEDAGRLCQRRRGERCFSKMSKRFLWPPKRNWPEFWPAKSFPCPVTGKTRPLDVRVMASTACRSGGRAQEGHFPVSLYECLTACCIHVPSLRERLQDIGLLTEHSLNHLAVVEGKPVKRLSVEGAQNVADARLAGKPARVGECRRTLLLAR